ncbi:MAG: RDD family protein [Saprospiraceae bacterium]
MKTIEILTTQNVTIDYELAGVRDRVIAFFIDGIIYTVFTFIMIFLVFNAQRVIMEMGEFLWTFISIGLYVGWIFYHVLFEIFNNGQSIGKKALGIKVVRIDGKEPGLFDFLLRGVFHLVDTLFTAGVVGVVLIASTDKTQRLGDMAANTTVIKKRSSRQFQLMDILGIQNTETYEPLYPEVTRLNEQEMLLIKNAISRYQEFPNKAHQEAIVQLTERLTEILGMKEVPKGKIKFLKTLLKDYIVLTR